jgi:hypothetical protein
MQERLPIDSSPSIRPIKPSLKQGSPVAFPLLLTLVHQCICQYRFNAPPMCYIVLNL